MRAVFTQGALPSYGKPADLGMGHEAADKVVDMKLRMGTFRSKHDGS